MKIHKILIAITLLIFSISLTERVVFSDYYKTVVTIESKAKITLLDKNRNSNSEILDYDTGAALLGHPQKS